MFCLWSVRNKFLQNTVICLFAKHCVVDVFKCVDGSSAIQSNQLSTMYRIFEGNKKEIERKYKKKRNSYNRQTAKCSPLPSHTLDTAIFVENMAVKWFYLIVANIVIVDDRQIRQSDCEVAICRNSSIPPTIIDNLNAKMPENILSSRSNNFVSKIYDRMHQIVRFSYNALQILYYSSTWILRWTSTGVVPKYLWKKSKKKEQKQERERERERGNQFETISFHSYFFFFFIFHFHSVNLSSENLFIDTNK